MTIDNITGPSGLRVDPMIALHGAVGCAAADVEVKAWFPDSPSLEFVVGQPMTAILGVRNNGPEGFNLTAVQGNLALVTDPSGNVFNFTGTVSAIFCLRSLYVWLAFTFLMDAGLSVSRDGS